ncbi:MAG: DUF456 domain-containing protein [Syntrophomonadaceae bacterium]|jgi:uncharacterized protein YqgC (DUF456 family)
MESLVIVVTIFFILLGIAGTFVPILPGVPLVFLSIAFYGWYEGFNVITWKYLLVLAGFTVLAIIIDYLATVFGAKYFGSSKKGMWGAVLGTFIGLFFFPPLGILLGPWLGAIIGEFLELQDIEKAFKVGVGTVVGLLSGMVFKLILAIGMALSFIIFLF